MAEPARQEVAEDIDSIPLEAEVVETIECHLRKGYYLKQGKRLITGPKKLMLDAETAKDHVHMFSNCGEIRETLNIVTPIRLDTKKRAELQQARMLTHPAFDRAVEVSVTRALENIIPAAVEAGVKAALAATGQKPAAAKRTSAKKRTRTRG